MKPLSRIALVAALVSHFALIAGLIAWCGVIAGAVLSLPLLVPLPGLLRRRTYTAAWASLLLVFYVAGLLSESYAIQSRHVVGLALSTVAALEFVSLLLFVRLSARERAELPAQKAASGAAAP
jgi:uncharacterized membrane protein